jgi:hypothetical protein
MPVSPFVKTQTYLRYSQVLELRKRSKLTGSPMSEIIRRLLDSAMMAEAETPSL